MMTDDTGVSPIQAFVAFVRQTPLFYAYQMLLLLTMFQANEAGRFSLSETVEAFDRFYRRREHWGLLPEKPHGNKQAQLSRKQLASTIKTGPYPRFARHGFLSLNEEKNQFMVQQALWEELPQAGAYLRALALERLTTHFLELDRERLPSRFATERHLIEALVQYAFDHETGSKG